MQSARSAAVAVARYAHCLSHEVSGSAGHLYESFERSSPKHVQAGGGIVADSVPHNEYMESANKAKAVMNAIERASEVDG